MQPKPHTLNVHHKFISSAIRFGLLTGYSEQISETREYVIQPHEFATLKNIILFTPNGYTQVKKSQYHKTDTVAKIREGIGMVVKKAGEVIGNVINKAKSFISSFFSQRKHSIWF